MKIELYLRSLLQEYPDSFKSATEWPAQWSYHHDYWEQWRYQSQSKTIDLPNGTARIKLLKLREEKFGGLLYDPISTAVFKVDREAFKTLTLLQNGLSLDQIMDSIRVPVSTLNEFIQKLKDLKLL